MMCPLIGRQKRTPENILSPGWVYKNQSKTSKTDHISSSSSALPVASHLTEGINIRFANSENSWRFKSDSKKVLVLFFPWLGSKEKHQERYKQVYLSKGLDVLTVESLASHFLWPPTLMKFQKHSLSVLTEHCNNYDHIIFHAMSIGAFSFTSLRMFLAQNNDSYNILQKCKGVVYDSIVAGSFDFKNDGVAIDKMLHGVAMSNKNKFVQKCISSLGKFYLYVTNKYTVNFYKDSIEFFRDSPLLVPTLIYSSKNDPMVDQKSLQELIDIWKNRNIPVKLVVWEKSGHAQHILKHAEEYTEILDQFLKNIFETNLLLSKSKL